MGTRSIIMIWRAAFARPHLPRSMDHACRRWHRRLMKWGALRSACSAGQRCCCCCCSHGGRVGVHGRPSCSVHQQPQPRHCNWIGGQAGHLIHRSHITTAASHAAYALEGSGCVPCLCSAERCTFREGTGAKWRPNGNHSLRSNQTQFFPGVANCCLTRQLRLPWSLPWSTSSCSRCWYRHPNTQRMALPRAWQPPRNAASSKPAAAAACLVPYSRTIWSHISRAKLPWAHLLLLLVQQWHGMPDLQPQSGCLHLP